MNEPHKADRARTDGRGGGGVSDQGVREAWAYGASRDIRDLLCELDASEESTRQIARKVGIPRTVVEVAAELRSDWFVTGTAKRGGYEVDTLRVTDAGVDAAKEDPRSEVGHKSGIKSSGLR